MKFSFNQSMEHLNERIQDWLSATPEGNRYRKVTPKSGEILKLKRGRGFWTAPIYLEFWATPTPEGPLTVQVNGYILAMLIQKQSLDGTARFGGLPRRNGWKDLMKLLSHLNVKDYKIIRQ
jgi:hypothetical protein